MKQFAAILTVMALAPLSAAAAEPTTAEPTIVENVTVYKQPNRFAGWPANNGIWSWGNEIVVGFTLGYHDDNKLGGHPIDRGRPEIPQQARSTDGGRTWKTEAPNYVDDQGREPEPTESLGGIDFTHENLALMFRMEGSSHGYSRFYYSYDRARTWVGPFKLPAFGRKGIFARTDYIVNGKHDLLAFLTAAKDGGGEGWPFAVRTTDGGKTWTFLGWIGPQPGDGGYAIMPSTLRMKNGALLSMIRRRGRTDGKKSWWLEAFLSPDDGHSWYMLDQPRLPNHGNPSHMIRLRDGRIALTYGWRNIPYGVRAKLSSDEGRTWSEELVLRQDGKSWDVGYPRTVQRADGKIITAYYFNDQRGKERYIAATIWDPSSVAVAPIPSDTAAGE
jgi:hypothetical protein